jgi:hypothetical protein
MKKIFACLMLLLYISASGGVVLNVHYCMGEVSSVNIDHSSNEGEHCEKCGMPEDSNSCCRSEFKMVKLDNLHKASVAVFNVDVPVAMLPTAVSLIDDSKLIANKADHPISYNPPEKIPNLNALFCVFRI